MPNPCLMDTLIRAHTMRATAERSSHCNAWRTAFVSNIFRTHVVFTCHDVLVTLSVLVLL